MLLMPQHIRFSKNEAGFNAITAFTGARSGADAVCNLAVTVTPRTTVAWPSPDPEHWLASLRPPVHHHTGVSATNCILKAGLSVFVDCGLRHRLKQPSTAEDANLTRNRGLG
jgi:hypothetical protein